MSLAVTFGGSLPSTDHAHVLRLDLHQRLRGEHVLDLGGADAVGQRAERAMRRGVAVAANQRHARQGEALLGADDVADALADIELVVVFEIEQLGVLRQIRDLVGAFLVGIGLGPVGGRHVVIDHEQRLVRRMDLAAGEPQPLERLRRRHLMDDVPVDVDEARAVRLFVDQMVGPDLVVEGAWLCHVLSLPAITNTCATFNRSRAQRKGPPRRLRHAARACYPAYERIRRCRQRSISP